MRRTLALVLSLALLAGCGGDDDQDNEPAAAAPAVATPTPGTLDLWVGGNFAGATPGTPYREWLDAQIERFKQSNSGSDVKLTLLSTDNEQVAAKLQAAFQARKPPDMMLFYSGGYTTPYEAQLLQLNEYFDATPGLFDSLSGMDLSCKDLDCKGGENPIIAVPQDFGTYGLFYNKAMFKKAGVEAPLESWDDLLAACDALKGTGVTPITFGDRDGYSTDNWITLMFGSTFDDGDAARINAGELPYADPKVVGAAAAARRPARGRLRQRGRLHARELRRQQRLHVEEERDGPDVPGGDPGLQGQARQGPRHHAAAAFGRRPARRPLGRQRLLQLGHHEGLGQPRTGVGVHQARERQGGRRPAALDPRHPARGQGRRLVADRGRVRAVLRRRRGRTPRCRCSTASSRCRSR